LANGVNPTDVLNALKDNKPTQIDLGKTRNEWITKARRRWLRKEGFAWWSVEPDVLLAMGLMTERERELWRKRQEERDMERAIKTE